MIIIYIDLPSHCSFSTLESCSEFPHPTLALAALGTVLRGVPWAGYTVQQHLYQPKKKKTWFMMVYGTFNCSSKGL